jgi:transcriptional regulator with XRE-family HTH domain
MEKKQKTSNAVDILHSRYIGQDSNRKASLQEERVNTEVARMIYELREEAGLTQKQLADLIGTTQSVISRLEDSDYEGHSLSMLSRIAKALNRRLAVDIKPEKEVNKMKFVFQRVVTGLRKEKRLKIDDFAKKVGIGKDDVISMECDASYSPTPFILYKLSNFYKIPERRLAILAGAIKEADLDFQAEASKFAAQSESFSKLTEEERRILDKFVKFLRIEDKKSDC